ncbi:MAG: peptidoglycan-binding protein [gamma proteobacterium endosymbiont of Lamellibrachia anaximandri]|nr:peptidoglycan-binding protein [gamma proteobacterium endosymbiont of Lamellibrachia anaximandri]
MDNRFDIAVTHLLEIEGGYVNDPADPGGETKFGISKRSYPDLDIQNLTSDQARSIYHRDYWQYIHCGKLPGPLAFVLFDAAVNHGPFKGVILLQQSLHVRADGINGPKTQAAAHHADIDETLLDFLSRRARFYTDIVTADSARARFLTGWLKRLFRLSRAIYLNQGELS